nr:tetratricopeptide repeat protein [uncultured Rhodoferax sp.]
MSPEDWQAVIRGEPSAAVQWMEAAAHLGNADAQVIYGQWCLDGHGMEPNAVTARANFLKSAIQAHPMGMNMAGRCSENGWGGDVDHFAAANWYRQAAHKGLDAGMYNYANLLASGQGVRKDPTAALEWYRRAARTGHAKSMTKIGHFYEDGRVVGRDVEQAFIWFEKGALGGDFRGQFNYASMLAERGRLADALFWLHKVPLTATVGYKRLAGAQLLRSPNIEIQAVGRTMLASLA